MSIKNVLINIFTFHLPYEIAIFGRVNNIWYMASRSDLIWRRFISFSNVIVEKILRDSWMRGTRMIKEDFELFPAIRLPRYVNCDAHGQFHSMEKEFPETVPEFYYTYCKLRMKEIRNGTIKLSDVHNNLLENMAKKRMKAEQELDEKLKRDRINVLSSLTTDLSTRKTLINDIITEFDLDSSDSSSPSIMMVKHIKQKTIVPVIKRYIMGRIIILPAEMIDEDEKREEGERYIMEKNENLFNVDGDYFLY